MIHVIRMSDTIQIIRRKGQHGLPSFATKTNYKILNPNLGQKLEFDIFNMFVYWVQSLNTTIYLFLIVDDYYALDSKVERPEYCNWIMEIVKKLVHVQYAFVLIASRAHNYKKYFKQ